jgi:hypothetical protein
MRKSRLNILKEAVETKKKVRITYQDDTGDRLLYPHAIYESEPKHILLDAYQIEGFTNSPSKFPKWKTFNIKNIKGIKVIDETFKVVKSFVPDSDRYANAVALAKE